MRLALILLLLVAPFLAASLSSCGQIGPGTYTLAGLISSQATCLEVSGDVTLDLNGKEISGPVAVIAKNATLSLKNGVISGEIILNHSYAYLDGVDVEGTVRAFFSDMQFKGGVDSKDVAFYLESSRANITANTSLIGGHFLRAHSSNVSIESSVLANFLSSSSLLHVENSTLALFDVAIYNLLSDEKPKLLDCTNSSVSLRYVSSPTLSLDGSLCNILSLQNIESEQAYFFGTLNGSLEGDYAIAVLEGGEGNISGSFDYLKLHNASANVTSSEIFSELLINSSDVTVFNVRFYPSGKLEAINSNVVVVNSLFCSSLPYYVYDFASNISFRRNYVSGVASLFSSGNLVDEDGDFIGDGGRAYPLGKELGGWLSDDFDEEPIIAQDISCILAPVKGRAQVDMDVSYDCSAKELSIQASFLNLPINFDAFVTKTSPPYETHEVSAFSLARVTIEEVGLYKITASSPGILPSTLFFNTYECDEPPKKERVEEVFITLMSEPRAGNEVRLKATLPDKSAAPFLSLIVRTPYGSEQTITTDEDGIATFTPFSAGEYSIMSPGITLLGDVAVEVLPKTRTYSATVPLSLDEEADLIISSKPSPVEFNLTIRSDGGDVVFSGAVNYSISIRLEPGAYVLNATSYERLSGLSVFIPPKSSVKSILTINDVVALVLILLVLGLPMVLSKKGRYKARVSLNENFVILAIKDFYNIPAKNVEVKVFRDGELVAEGLTDSSGVFSFLADKKGTYIAYVDGKKVEGAVLKLR